jgi:hypothetical protein
LTTHEQVCQWWGIIYHATAIDRDRRIPITTTIEMARKIAFDSAPSDPTKAARLAEHLVTAVRDVYTTPAVSPDQYRYVMELACINGSMAPETAPAAAGPKY